MIYDVINVILDTAPYHTFFNFLGGLGGDLIKYSTELIIFFAVTYMILSEHVKSQKREYRYMGIAFMALTIKSAIMAIFYFHLIFGRLKLKILRYFIPVIQQHLEIFGIIMLAAAFLFPLFRDKIKGFQHTIWSILVITFGISTLIEIFWFFSFLDNKSLEFNSYAGTVIFTLIKIFLLIGIIIILRKNKQLKSSRKLSFAFSIYMISPITALLSFILFKNNFKELVIFQYPFPILAALLFARIIYLKLVDKAYLKTQLIDTRLKYKHEKKLSELKDHFVSVVSHELRTPLTSIKLYISLLIQGKFGKMIRKQKDALYTVNDETDRLTELINDILDINRYESNKERLELSEFDVKEIIDPLYLNLAEKKGIKIKVEVPSRLIVIADKKKLKQVLINLIGNAIKFTKKGGWITVKFQTNHEYWMLIVKDTGEGIEKENIPKLFDKFYQVQSHMTRAQGGSGLGLTIAKQIIDLHKGRIKVESKLGKGSIFTAYIPKHL